MDLAARFAVLAVVIVLPGGAALAGNVLGGYPQPRVPTEVKVGGLQQEPGHPAPPTVSTSSPGVAAPYEADARPRLPGRSEVVVPPTTPAAPPTTQPTTSAQPPPTATTTVVPPPPPIGDDDDGDDGGGGDDGDG